MTSATGDEDERTRSVASFRRRVQRMTGHRPVEQKEKIHRAGVVPEEDNVARLVFIENLEIRGLKVKDRSVRLTAVDVGVCFDEGDRRVEGGYVGGFGEAAECN